MFVSQDYIIGFRDIDSEYKLTPKALLGFFEDTAGIHSSKIGYGLLDISKTNFTWFLISIKVKILNYPSYGEKITVTTWSNGKNKLYAFRDYEAKNEDGEVIAIASSKWLPIDTKTLSIIKLTDEIYTKYEIEDKFVFEEEINNKIKEPKSYLISKDYTITKAMIDMQNHVHNTYYMNFILEILPKEYESKKIKDLEILYKNQIFYNEKVKILFSHEEDDYYVVIKSEDESKLHSIITFNFYE